MISKFSIFVAANGSRKPPQLSLSQHVAPFSLLALLAATAPLMAQPSFEDRSDTLPLHSYEGGWEHFVGGGLVVFDCDGDTLPELLAAGGTSPAMLLHNDGDFRFSPAPFPAITGMTGAYPIDIDGDDYLDLYVLRVGPDQVLQGGPECSFSDVTESWAVPAPDSWTTAFTAWWEGDDLPTLAIGHYVDRADPNGPFEVCDDNALLRPTRLARPASDGPGTAAFGYHATPLTPGFCALSMLAARDARGRPSLRISNDRQYYVRGGSEQMWDIADQRFLTEVDGWQRVALWGMGIASRDLTGDGRDEVMLTSMGDQLLQLAQPDGTYVGAPYGLGTTAHRPYLGDDGRPSTGWHAQFGDVDNDGRADLFIAKGNVDQMPTNAIHDPNNLLMQQPDGTFVEVGDIAGIATTERSRGAALADLDNDGRLDLVVVNRRAPLELYRNITPDTGNWLSIALQQPGGNREAIGATVTVEGPFGPQIQQVTIGGGHGSGQALPLHFGLGTATTTRVTVTWPDGSQSGPLDASANTPLTINRSPQP